MFPGSHRLQRNAEKLGEEFLARIEQASGPHDVVRSIGVGGKVELDRPDRQLLLNAASAQGLAKFLESGDDLLTGPGKVITFFQRISPDSNWFSGKPVVRLANHSHPSVITRNPSP